MTRAIVVVPGGTSELTDAQVLRLCAQLTRVGVASTTLVAPPDMAARFVGGDITVHQSHTPADDIGLAGKIARNSPSPVVLCLGDVIAHDAAFDLVLSSGGRRCSALVGPIVPQPDHLHPLVRRDRGRVVSVASEKHEVTEPNASFRGVLSIAASDLIGAASLCDSLTLSHGDTDREPTGGLSEDNAVEYILLALVRSGIPVTACPVGSLTCRRAAGDEAELGDVDEEKARLRNAIKEEDGLFATYGVSTFSPRVVRLLATWGVSPNTVTWGSTALALASAVAFMSTNRPTWILGAILLYLGFLFDCADGQLARYSGRFSRHGAWLDAVADRAKELAVYAGVAIGAARSGDPVAWTLALAAAALLLVRHTTDAWYGALQETALGRFVRVPLHQQSDGFASASQIPVRSRTARAGATLARVSAALEARRATLGYWAKRVVVLSIGERWLVIGVLTPTVGPRAMFTMLLIWGGGAAVYTLIGRSLRASALRVPVAASFDLRLHRDDGPLAVLLGGLVRGRIAPLPAALPAVVFCAVVSVVGRVDAVSDWTLAAAALTVLVASAASSHPHEGSLDWLVFAALRAIECGLVVLVCLDGRMPIPLILALLAAIAMYHYDLTARVDGARSPLGSRRWTLGWDGRILLLVSAGVFDVGGLVTTALAGYLATSFLIGSVIGVYRPSRRRAQESVSVDA